jgi:hypothetical protein
MTPVNLSFMRIVRMATGLLCLSAFLVAGEPQAYDKVITKHAKTTKGIFTVHHAGDEYYYEIPKDQLDQEFLWNARIAETTKGVGFGGTLVADHVVRWELRGDRVLLRDVDYASTADPRTPMAAAVKASSWGTGCDGPEDGLQDH